MNDAFNAYENGMDVLVKCIIHVNTALDAKKKKKKKIVAKLYRPKFGSVFVFETFARLMVPSRRWRPAGLTHPERNYPDSPLGFHDLAYAAKNS